MVVGDEVTVPMVEGQEGSCYNVSPSLFVPVNFTRKFMGFVTEP